MKSWVRDATRLARSPNCGLPPLIYDVNKAKLDAALVNALVPLDCDQETHEFLQSCTQESVVQAIKSHVLSMFYSRTDVNGMLGRGQMFVLSSQQIRQLFRMTPTVTRASSNAIDPANDSTSQSNTRLLGESLLDIGAGDGNVTMKLASYVNRVMTTEVSSSMVNQLHQKGYACVQCCELDHDAIQTNAPFEVISLLNVLDRADKPKTLLQQIYQLLPSDKTGLFLLAVVCPFSAFVEKGTRQVAPTEILPMQGGLCADGNDFEDACNVLWRKVLQPMGFSLRSFARVPYLCRGDFQHPFYVLDDAVFVLEKPPNAPQELTS